MRVRKSASWSERRVAAESNAIAKRARWTRPPRRRKSRDGNAFWHLHGRQQGILAAQILRWYGDAQYRQHGLRGKDSRQMRGTAGTGNDAGKPARGGTFGVRESVIGRAMRGEDLRLMRHTEGGQLKDRVLHDLPIAIAALTTPTTPTVALFRRGMLSLIPGKQTFARACRGGSFLPSPRDAPAIASPSRGSSMRHSPVGV